MVLTSSKKYCSVTIKAAMWDTGIPYECQLQPGSSFSNPAPDNSLGKEALDGPNTWDAAIHVEDLSETSSSRLWFGHLGSKPVDERALPLSPSLCNFDFQIYK